MLNICMILFLSELWHFYLVPNIQLLWSTDINNKLFITDQRCNNKLTITEHR